MRGRDAPALSVMIPSRGGLIHALAAPDAHSLPKGCTMKQNSSLAITGLALGHVRSNADVRMMQRHELPSAGNCLNFSTAPRRPIPPVKRKAPRTTRNGNTPSTPAAAMQQVAA